jgi:O-antigen/teichoic acid export membrane protein
MNLGLSTFKLLLSKSGNSILFFVGITIFARYLSAEELGIFFLFLAISGLASIPADFGIRGALEKRLSEGNNPEQMLGSALAFKFVTLTLVSLILLAASKHINGYLGSELTNLLVIGIIFQEFAKFYVQVVRGELRVGETAPIIFARRLVWIILGVGFVVTDYGARGIIIALICGRIIELSWAILKSDTAIGKPSIETLFSLIAFSKYQTINEVGGRVYQWIDIIIIGFFLSQAYVGAYEIAWQVTLLVLLVSKSIELSIFPQISQWEVSESTERIESTISSSLGFALFFSVPAVIGSAIYAEEILVFIFGSEYTIAALVLVILMVEKLFQSFNGVIGSTVRALDRPDLAARATVITVIINFVLSPILIVTVGFIGAAVATTFSWFINAVLHKRYLSQLIVVDIPYRLFSYYVASSLLMGVVLLIVRQFTPVTSLIILCSQIALGVVIYLGASVIIPDVRYQIIQPGLRVFS